MAHFGGPWEDMRELGRARRAFGELLDGPPMRPRGFHEGNQDTYEDAKSDPNDHFERSERHDGSFWYHARGLQNIEKQMSFRYIFKHLDIWMSCWSAFVAPNGAP